MPPDPILGLLAFVGLCLYAIIGVIVGVLTVRYMGNDRERLNTIATWQMSPHASTDFRAVAVMIACVWPVWLVILAAAGVLAAIVAVGWGIVWVPWRLGRHTAQWVAGSLQEGHSNA